MTNLENLISKLCSDGVLYSLIADVTFYEQPGKYIVKNTNYNDAFHTPVLTAGQSFVLGRTNETAGIYEASKDSPVIIFDDFTGAFKWVDFSFKVKSSALKILTSDEKKICLRYLYHVMGSLGFTSDEHKRLWIATYSQLRIPLPPLPVQREIVRILDNFTELTAELTAELAARRKQYEHYRDELLTFGDEVPRIPLGEVGPVCMCKRILKSQTNDVGGVPFYKIGTFGKQANAYISKETYEEYRNKYNFPKKGDILISAAGTIGRTVVYDGEPAYFQDSNIVWVANDETKILNRFLIHCYAMKPWYVSTGGTIARLYNDNILKAVVPVPSLERQKFIVDTLDRFDTLCNDLTSGLPAEIAARQKQYEYYRDKLLTFGEKEN